MNIVSQVTIVTLCVAFLIYVIHLVVKGRLLLKYSLIWMFLAAVILFCAFCPYPVSAISHCLGFDVTSNFVFFVGMAFLLSFCLALSVIASKQSMSIKQLTQRLAIIEKELTDNKKP